MTLKKIHDTLVPRLAAGMKRIREAQGLSRNTLADIVGINPEYLAQLERGQRTPSLGTMELIARALDVDVSDLLKEI